MDRAEILRKNYENIFSSDEVKAKAFDKIAEKFFLGNFGMMQKTDTEVLLFSIYIEEILNQSEEDINTYSDYTLSKQLGITQSKISSLKVKKQLQYPYEKFNWKESFRRSCAYVHYEKGKIRINLRDKNLYYELKNQIDEAGGYVETTLTSDLLVISPMDFFELIEGIMSKEEIDEIKRVIKKRYDSNKSLIGQLEKESIGKTIRSQFGETAVDVIFELIKEFAPAPLGVGVQILRTTFDTIREKEH